MRTDPALEIAVSCVKRAGRSLEKTAEIVERSCWVLARSRQLMIGRPMKMDRQAELQRLAGADAHIASAELAASRLIVEIETRRRFGYDVQLAEVLLNGIRSSLEAMRRHRKEILRTIAEIDQRTS
ncbi:hypothetical protein [Bradyrhizobium sp. UFLA05-112]